MNLTINLRDIVTFVIALASFCAGVGFLARPGRRAFRDLRDMREALTGEPAQPELGKPARPGLFVTVAELRDTVAELQATVSVVRHEVETNGGGSLKDSVRVIQRDQQTIQRDLAALKTAGDARESERAARERDPVNV